MSFSRSYLVISVCLYMLACLDAQRLSGRRRQSVRPAAPVYSGDVAEEVYPPQPHNFAYDVTDEYGNQRFHNEQGDGSGRVTGSYGYRDANGIYRTVEYVADENGYRATVKSNEPGMDNPPPADVQYALEPAPASAYAVPATRRSYRKKK